MKSSKELIFCVVVIIAAAIGFICLNYSLNNYWLLALTLILLPLTWALYITLSKNIYFIVATATVSTSTFFMVFPYKTWYLASAVILIVSLVFGFVVSLSLKKNLITQSVSSIASTPLAYLMYGMVTVISFTAFYSPLLQDLKNGIKIPDKYLELVANKALPGFSNESTVDSMINDALKIPDGQKIDDEQRKIILEQLGIEEYNLKGSEILVQNPKVLSDLFTTKVNEVVKSMGDLVPLIAASTLWSLLIILAKMIVPLILIIDSILLKLLIKIGFATISSTTIEREELGF